MPSLSDLCLRLVLLNEVAAGRRLTQRSLAGRLGVSLGQANKLLRGLEGEGLIRVDAEGAPRYALTEEGRGALMEGALQFAAGSRALLGPLRAQMAREAKGLRAAGCRKALLCAGEALAAEAVAALLCAGIKLTGVLLRDASERRTVAGVPVLTAAACRKSAFDAAVAATPQEADLLRQCLGRRRRVALLLPAQEGRPRG